MAADLLTRIKQFPALCDGAMGTLLYATGVFINRCYDELNLSQPDLIRGVHHDYLQAGADIVETNTFGANAFRLARHSLADKVHEINRVGAKLAREAAKSFDVWVAGSVGPLGTRIEPLGKTSFEEAPPRIWRPDAGVGDRLARWEPELSRWEKPLSKRLARHFAIRLRRWRKVASTC